MDIDKNINKTNSKGYKEGLHRTYFSDGSLSMEINYKNGARDGFCVSYRKNGNKHWEAYYVDGILNGSLRYWYEQNNIYFLQEAVAIQHYVYGIKEGEEIVYG